MELEAKDVVYLHHHHDGQYAECEHEHDEKYASKGTAGAGLGLGIGGVVLGGAALLKEWVKGERHEGRGGYGYEGGYGEGGGYVSKLQAELAQQKAERFAEYKDFENYKELSYKIDMVAKDVCNLGQKVAVNATYTEGLKDSLIDTKLTLKQEFMTAIKLEAERRECGDNELHGWTECNFIKAKKVIDKHQICPEVMDRWNSWVAPTGVEDNA